MTKLVKAIKRISIICNYIGIAWLPPLMLLTTVDVFLRYFFNRPLRGAVEYSEVMLVVIVWLGLAYTSLVKGHVRMEFFFSRFSPRNQTLASIFACLLGLVLMIIIAKTSFGMALNSWQMALATDVAKFPLCVPQWVLCVGAIVLGMQLLAETLFGIAELQGRPLVKGES